jgi:hypothetical protein
MLADAATVARFQDDLRLLPRYVMSMCTWQLGRVKSAVGTSPWTHPELLGSSRRVAATKEMLPRRLDGLDLGLLDHLVHARCRAGAVTGQNLFEGIT